MDDMKKKPSTTTGLDFASIAAQSPHPKVSSGVTLSAFKSIVSRWLAYYKIFT